VWNFIFQWCYSALIVPARHLFLAGPTLMGCWSGMPLQDVCAGMTGVPAAFWASASSADECHDIIDRHVWSYLVPLYVALYFWGVYCTLHLLVTKIKRYVLYHPLHYF
jgi:hypothetical protein